MIAYSFVKSNQTLSMKQSGKTKNRQHSKEEGITEEARAWLKKGTFKRQRTGKGLILERWSGITSPSQLNKNYTTNQESQGIFWVNRLLLKHTKISNSHLSVFWPSIQCNFSLKHCCFPERFVGLGLVFLFCVFLCCGFMLILCSFIHLVFSTTFRY